MSKPDWTLIAEVELVADLKRVADFAAALGGTGAQATDRVPATFAFTVLSRPEILGALEEVAARRSAVLVHQAQQFHYARDLVAGDTYRVAIDWHRNPDREDRIVVRGRVRDAGDRHCQEFLADIVLFENRQPASEVR